MQDQEDTTEHETLNDNMSDREAISNTPHGEITETDIGMTDAEPPSRDATNMDETDTELPPLRSSSFQKNSGAVVPALDPNKANLVTNTRVMKVDYPKLNSYHHHLSVTGM